MPAGRHQAGAVISYTLNGTTPAPPVHPRLTSRLARRHANTLGRLPSTQTHAWWPEPTTRGITTLPANPIPQSAATGRARGKRSTLRNPEGIDHHPKFKIANRKSQIQNRSPIADNSRQRLHRRGELGRALVLILPSAFSTLN